MISHARRFMTLVEEKRIRDRRNAMSLPDKVNPYRWAPSAEFGFKINFGDELMALVFEYLSERSLEWNQGGLYDRTLYVGGSVIDMARDGDVVWGAGIRDFSDQMMHFRKNLKVFSVRGPLTRHFLMMKGVDCPAVFGDPGIFVPELFPDLVGVEQTVVKGIVPHYTEYEQTVERFADNAEVLVIDPRRSAREVVQDIVRCQRVASSSLHGIIVAEAFGIPVFWWREKSGEPFYKYYDYYLSTDRAVEPVVELESGFEMLESEGFKPVDFSGQKIGLKKAFSELGQVYDF